MRENEKKLDQQIHLEEHGKSTSREKEKRNAASCTHALRGCTWPLSFFSKHERTLHPYRFDRGFLNTLSGSSLPLIRGFPFPLGLPADCDLPYARTGPRMSEKTRVYIVCETWLRKASQFHFSSRLQVVQLTWKAFAIEVSSNRMDPMHTFANACLNHQIPEAFEK